MKQIENKRGTMAVAKHAMVTSAWPLVTKAGLEVLKADGNAMDAYIAAVIMEQVAAPGTTSLAGPMGLLYYDAKTKKTYYLDAGFNIPKNGLGAFNFEKDQTTGKSVLIPGTVAGLEAASKRFGRLPFKNLFGPGIRAARTGFKMNRNIVEVQRQ